MIGVDEDCEKRKQEIKNRKKETGKKGEMKTRPASKKTSIGEKETGNR